MKIPILCQCGSSDWIRCDPGIGSAAEIYGESNVLPLFPDPGTPAVAFCLRCDPLLRLVTP